MAQVSWIFLSEQGGRHRVGLYHGDRTGHLAIYCDMRVVQVDFGVKESRMYSFFIEDDLCEVRLVKVHGRFSYEFNVNTDVDTPLNQARKKRDRKNRLAIGSLVGALALVLAGIFALVHYNQQQEERRRLSAYSLFSQPAEQAAATLKKNGRRTSTCLLIVQDAGHRMAYYGFNSPGNMRVYGKFSVTNADPIILPSGMPLSDGDTFEVLYSPDDPQIHLVDFAEPDSATQYKYLQQAVLAEQAAHPDKTARQCSCLANTVFEEAGWQALGNLIFQQKAPEDSPKFNADSYQRLIRDDVFSAKIKARCWDQ